MKYSALEVRQMHVCVWVSSRWAAAAAIGDVCGCHLGGQQRQESGVCVGLISVGSSGRSQGCVWVSSQWAAVAGIGGGGVDIMEQTQFPDWNCAESYCSFSSSLPKCCFVFVNE